MVSRKKENVYVQPECEVVQVLEQQLIAYSKSAEGGSNEVYDDGNTSDWF